jgi:GAF domain-containing protein
VTQDVPLADELASVLARMSGLLLSHETVGTALGLVTALVKETMPAAVGAGVTLVDERGARTTANATDPVVEQADLDQYALSEGPCLSAWASRTVFRIDDLSTEERWPRWCKVARTYGLRSCMSAPLLAGNSAVGAIKVYSDRTRVFDEHDERRLVMFAGPAAVLLANIQSYDDARRLGDHLKEALGTRDVIGMAKGILMARDGVDDKRAFAMLVSVSQRRNMRLREVARELVASVIRRHH